MVHIKFEYKDELSRGKWNQQECTVSSLKECIKIYGLGVDCEYRILSVEEVKDKVCKAPAKQSSVEDQIANAQNQTSDSNNKNNKHIVVR